MKDTLREKLSSVLEGVVDIYSSEAEENSYPYAVYEMTTAPIYDKDGISHFEGDATIMLVGDSFDDLDDARADVENAIATQMRDSSFSSRLRTIDKDCVEGIWTIELTYTLKQYAEWAQPVEQNND